MKVLKKNAISRKPDIPDFLYFDQTEWIDSAEMTEKEKAEHDWNVVRGYLKRHTYKSAARKALKIAKKKPDWLALLKALPNFDYDIFEEITGITKEDLES